MSDELKISGPGGLNRSPKVGELANGGFRSNRHHEGIEEMADERDIGRDTLHQSDGGYPDNLLESGHSDMMKAWGAGGVRENTKVSKWSKK